MKVGTKSILFGAHAFWLHPLLLAVRWWKAYGIGRVVIQEESWPTVRCLTEGCTPRCARVTTHLLDPRLWLAFFVHDQRIEAALLAATNRPPGQEENA